MFLSKWREFLSAPFLGRKNLTTARVSVLLKSRASLTCLQAKNLSALRYNSITFSLKLASPMEVVRLIKIRLNETYSRVRVGKELSDMFPITNGLKQGDAVSPLLFNFDLAYVIG